MYLAISNGKSICRHIDYMFHNDKFDWLVYMKYTFFDLTFGANGSFAFRLNVAYALLNVGDALLNSSFYYLLVKKLAHRPRDDF